LAFESQQVIAEKYCRLRNILFDKLAQDTYNRSQRKAA